MRTEHVEASAEMSAYEKGKAAALELWRHWRKRPRIDDPRDPEFARGALETIVSRLAGSDDVDKEIREYSETAAEQLTTANRTVYELLQNADDLKADTTRFALRRKGRGLGELLIVHNGDPVVLPDVIAMTLAFLSWKRGDAAAKGRFGIGLKTLNQLGTRLSVHCPPYHFAVQKGRIEPITPVREVRNLFDASAGETLLILHLDQEFGVEDIVGWIRAIDASHLIFLDYVRTLSLTDLRTGQVNWRVGLREQHAAPVELEMRPGAGYRALCSTLSDIVEPRRTWSRYSIDYPVPQDLKRSHKATGSFTPLSIAISLRPEAGILAAGMPLDFRTSLPISLNAQFDPDLGRRGLSERKWNRWLFGRLGELAAAVAQLKFEHEIATAWQAVPLEQENIDGDPWVVKCVGALIRAVHDRIRARVRITVNDERVRLADLSYESAEIDGVLTADDYRRLAPDHIALSTTVRDSAGRWRQVLDDLGVALRIEVEQAVELLDLDDDELGQRSIDWFIKLADAAIAVGLEDRLSDLRSIVASDGARYAPAGDVLLVRQSDERNIAARLGLEKRVAPGYFSASTPPRVREWLDEHCVLKASADPASILGALSRRTEDEPLPVDDDTLIMLREALHAVDDVRRPSLAAAVGNVIAVDGYTFRNKKKVKLLVKPAFAYLPTPIAKDTRGWAAAAKATEGLQWIDPRYATELRVGTAGEFGAKRFFLLLGAAVGPRLVASGDGSRVPLKDELPIAQADALEMLTTRQRVTHLIRDWVSPDLERVIADIVRQRVDGKRRERSRALFETLAREWERMAERSEATATYMYYSWRDVGAVPATWLAHTASEPWLSSKSRRKVAPREVAIESAMTRLTRGSEKSQYVNELDESDSAHPLVAALGIKGTPPASELIAELKAIKERHGTKVRQEDVQPLYAALAALVPRDTSQRVGDLSAADVRRAFNSDNLLLAGGQWMTPQNTFRGRPIFGQRRFFVPAHRSLVPLWQLLQIRHPEALDCLKVLEEIAGSAAVPSREEQAIIVDVLRHLADQTAPFTSVVKGRMSRLPLWTSRGWQKQRPIYAVHDRRLEESLGEQATVWRSGCAIQSLGEMPRLLGIDVITDEQFTIAPESRLERADGMTAMMFRRAVAHLKSEFARKNHHVWNSMDWDRLSRAQLVKAEPLLVNAVVGGRKVSVGRRIHIDRGRLYFMHSDDLGTPDAGGRVAAAFFSGPLPEMLDYAWSYAWREAEEKGAPDDALDLAAEPEHQDLLQALVGRSKDAAGKRLFVGGALPDQRRIGKTKIASSPPPRRLKSFDEAKIAHVEIVDGARTIETRARTRNSLLVEMPTSPGARKMRGPVPDPVREWSEEERERRGFEVLAAALRTLDQSELEDFRAIRRLGADSIDQLKRYFELKAHLGDAPDDVRFEPTQFERAVREGKNYFLAVVSGLEEGRETVIRIFPDPVRNLHWSRTTMIKLSGIRSGASKVLRISIET